MKTIHEEPNWKAVMMKKGEQLRIIPETAGEYLGEFMPFEVYCKPDGDINNNPSLIFILKNRAGQHIAGQVSMEMFERAYSKIKKEVTAK